MSRVMSLRGGFEMTVGRSTQYGYATEVQIFNYESPNRTMAWKVKKAYIWIQECFTGTQGGDSRMLAQWTLSTDTLGGAPGITSGDDARAWERDMGARDNRTIGWLTADYQNRDNVDGDFIVPAAGWGSNEMILDADRLITNELWIQSYGITEASPLEDIEVNYYIELEQVKVSPAESTIQQIKGMGQSIQ